MELSGYTAPERPSGDGLPAKEATDKPLIVQVREYRESVTTKFAPEGKPGVQVDVVDVTADTTYIDCLWMNGAIVDALGQHVAKALPIKLVWTPGKSGYPYISVAPLEGAELEQAAKWAAANPTRLEDERAERGFSTKQAPGVATTTGGASEGQPKASNEAEVNALLEKINNG